MPFTQIRYQGATIANFRASLGLGDKPSSLNVTVLEDLNAGDSFVPPTVGYPTYFDYNGWAFGGIVQNWSRRRGKDGFLFDVVINDPRFIISGTQMIVSGYTGQIYNVPNLYNVYGYIESTYGYGATGVSEQSGTLASLIITCIQAMTNTNPIKLRGYEYYLDLTGLASITPADFRIQEDSISIFDLINHIANITVSDYFIRLEYRNFKNYIVPYFVSRANPPALNAIGNFITNSEAIYGNVSNTVGRELINEPTSKFLVGGNVNYVNFVFQNLQDEYVSGQAIPKMTDLLESYSNYIGTSLDATQYLKDMAREATIWPYWGNDALGNTILGWGPPSARWRVILDAQGNPNGIQAPQWVGLAAHRFTIDGRAIAEIYKNPALSDYPTDIDEMYFSLFGFDQWLYYIIVTSSMGGCHPNAQYNGTNTSKFEVLQINSLIPNVLLEYDFGTVAAPNKVQINVPGGQNLFLIYNTWVNSPVNRTNSFLEFMEFFTNWFNHNIGIITSIKAGEETLLKMKLDAGFFKSTPAVMDRLKYVYSIIRDYAEKYYGKKFMVKIPSIKAKRDPDTGIVRFNLRPSDGGYVEESAYPFLFMSGMVPYEINKVTLEDNRLQAYVRYPLYTVIQNQNPIGTDQLYFPSLDIKDVQNEALWSWYKSSTNDPRRDYVFVKCEIDSQPVFLDNQTLDDPRFIITLPGKVCASEDYRTGSYAKMVLNYIWWLYNYHYNRLGIQINAADKATAWDMIVAQIGGNINSIGGDKYNVQEEHAPMTMPDMVALTLEDETQSYGPWYVSGLEGTTEYQKDDSLVPWNFGGYDLLNAAANSRVLQALSNHMEVESGNVEFPGAPAFLVGDAFETYGPVITDVNVNIDPQGGATTTYNLQTWTARFGEMQKYYIDKITQLRKDMKHYERTIRDIINYPRQSAGTVSNINFIAGAGPTSSFVRRLKRNTSTSEYLMGEVLSQADASGNVNRIRGNVATTPEYYLESQVLQNYNNKSVVSMDAIFRPFTTDVSVTPSSLPHFETPVAGASSPTVTDLHPFSHGHDISVISQAVNVDDTYLSNATTETNLLVNPNINDPSQSPPANVKGIAFKGPLLITGWGYDTDGKPVPAKPTDSNSFMDQYHSRMDQWKTGPVDLRWDNDRKVWAAGGGANLYYGELANNIYTNGSGNVYLYDTTRFPPYIPAVPQVVMAYEWLSKGVSNFQLYTGQRVVMSKVNNRYLIINAGNATCLE